MSQSLKKFRSYILFLYSLLFLPVVTSAALTALQQGQLAFEQGNFEQAIREWEIALRDASLETEQRIDILIHLATTYQEVGHYAFAQAVLQQALSIGEDRGTPTQKILIHSHLGDILLATQQIDTAQMHLEKGLAIARDLNNPLLLAHVLNNFGNLLSVQEEYTQALEYYTQATQLAERSDELALKIQSLANKSRTALKQGDASVSIAALETALYHVRNQPGSLSKGFELLSLGQLANQLQKRFTHISFSYPIYQIFNDALGLAEQYHNKRLMAYAKGYLGQFYGQNQRHQEALRLTREAIFLSQGSSDLLYRWEWQRGSFLQAQKDLAGATKAYQQALVYLQPIRAELTTGQRDAQETFYERIRPVYFSLADVLLQQAAVISSSSSKTKLLEQAIDAVEQLKIAELQNYFQDECVSKVKKKLDRHLDKHTAVFYPILLPDRIELLLSFSDGTQQVTVPVAADILAQTVLEFQQNLQIRTNFSFLEQSGQLYNWLIAPILPKLKAYNISTLVIVPDGPLRMIPMAALNDGKQYLIQTVALATTPGLDLTESQPLSKQNITVLLNGLSEGVQSFSPLPSVTEEISSIRSLFDNSAVLLNQTFLLGKVGQVLQKSPYSIVHVASHGQFDRDPKKTFLLTYDSKLTMDRLERLLGFNQAREEPVELLTLSACQTAVGDEQAALGLAGVAIKAGARSALASLWSVNDESTALLVVEFYRQLKDPQLSKAQALQNAQKKLIEHPIFRHPAYWSAFLLIGNWL